MDRDSSETSPCGRPPTSPGHAALETHLPLSSHLPQIERFFRRFHDLLYGERACRESFRMGSFQNYAGFRFSQTERIDKV